MRYSVICFFVLSLFLTSCHKQETTSSESESSKTVQKTPSVAPIKSTLERSYFLKHNFGDVDAGQKLTCSLELKNETDKLMSFGFSSTSCGACLSVKSKPEKIEPGKTGIFELEFDTTGKRGLTPQHAYFWDAEPKTLLVVADITATIRAIWTDPEMIALGNLSTNEAHKTKLYVMAAGLPDAKVTSAECDASWLTLTSKPVETSKELKSQSIRAIDYYEIEWTGKDTKPGNLATKIIFHVQNGNEDKILEVPVSGYLSGDVEIVPAQIVFGRVAKDEVVRTCTLTFKKPNIDPTKIKCTADHDSIKVNFAKSKNTFVLTTRIAPPSETTNQLIEGKITGVDESGETIFSVPYIAFFNTSL
ncbi:MAG: DUF1573 domain-containing protein [Planctomycetaceae bacterium]|jgi:hypothetical protein|nr:DUF1573 domain-containing protein [Planctomycetaceae bacterium]